MKNKVTISDLIKNDYKKWSKEDVIIFNAGTGSGKTYAILNVLGQHCVKENKKILFLCNRNQLQQDLEIDINFLSLDKIPDLKSHIKVITYQLLANLKNSDDEFDADDYDYIVYDEAHYITSEGWNCNTDRVWEFFNKYYKEKVSIFMSATGHNIFTFLETQKYFKNKDYEYKIEVNYSYVEKLVFYNNDDYVEEIFNNLKEDEKLIYFARKLDKAVVLFEKYKDRANFICSRYKKKYQEINQHDIKNNKKCITTYSKDLITFDKQILITTTALDVGITLKDKRIKHIIVDLVDIISLQQCLGRKRIIDKDDTCIFHIKNHSKNSLLGHYRTINNNIYKDAYDYYFNRDEFIKNLKSNRRIQNNPCFYFDNDEIDSTKQGNSIVGDMKFNYFTFVYYMLSLGNINTAIKISFDNLVLNKLGDTIKNVEYMEDVEAEKEKDELELYLESIFGKKLFKNEQKELIEKIGLRDARKRLQKSVSLLNVYLEKNNLPYIIDIPKRPSYRDENGNVKKEKTHWMIKKIIG